MRWVDYVMGEGDDATELWRAARRANTETLYVLGGGFDPRALVGLQRLVSLGLTGGLRVLLVALRPGIADPMTSSFAEQNQTAFAELVETTGIKVDQLDYPEGVDSRAAGQHFGHGVIAGHYLDNAGLVIVDVSGMPSGIYFPVIGAVLSAARVQGGYGGNIHVVACENAVLDEAILEEGSTGPGPIHGFENRLDAAVAEQATKVWAPVLGRGSAVQLEALYNWLAPEEICPVLPFPAANPRRADDLILEYRSLLFDVIEVEPRNFIYAHETNPFDLYRTLCELHDRYRVALEPLGPATVVVSTHASKLLGVGTLLAAFEKGLPVVSVGPTDYSLAPDMDLTAVLAANHLTTLWLEGDPYR
jgi:hypothetical protein